MDSEDRLFASITVGLSPEAAFERFIDIGTWWPNAYTWSGEALEDVVMDARAGGLLSEIGPHGFRCDFGRILAIEQARRLLLAWQISARREPQPDPARASEVEVTFAARDGGRTLVTLTHSGFARHGADHEAYRNAMASDQGWPTILRCFAGKEIVGGG